MKSIADHLADIEETTIEYVELYNRQRAEIVEGRQAGCSIEQLARAARVRPEVVAYILGEEL